MIRIDPEAQEVNPIPYRKYLEAVLVRTQTECREELDYLGPMVPNVILARAKQQGVVSVSEVTLDVEASLDELVQLVEIDVGPELARQVADGQSFGA